jgi:hypothetical protein
MLELTRDASRSFMTLVNLCFYLHELHEPELHDEQPEEGCFSTPLMPNIENFLITSAELQAGQHTCVLPKTSFSKSDPQDEHLYSNIGMCQLLLLIFFIIAWSGRVLELLGEIVYFNIDVYIMTAHPLCRITGRLFAGSIPLVSGRRPYV